MLRALSEDMKVSFINNDRTNEFVVIISRQTDNSDTLGTNSDTQRNVNPDTVAIDHDTKSDTGSDTSCINSDTKRPVITNKQRDIVNFCNVPRSSKEILERAGVTYHSKNIQTYIMSLVEAGYLEMTNPEHPTASNQKYKRCNR